MNEKKINQCLYNDGVDCNPHDMRFCEKCGWNPEVAREREQERIDRKSDIPLKKAEKKRVSANFCG